ncbi:MAG: hypothetical protein CMM02_07600 [Rhodopirellula sp.]|nr:hypothetical protein [Rhodopirellula sp.]
MQKDYVLLSGHGSERKRQAREKQQQQIQEDEALARQLLADEERGIQEHQRKQSLKADALGEKLQFVSAGPKWNPVEGTRQSCKPNYFKVHNASRAFKILKKTRTKLVAAVVGTIDMDVPENFEEGLEGGLGEGSVQGKRVHIPCPFFPSPPTPFFPSPPTAQSSKGSGLYAAARKSSNQYGSSSLQIQAAELASRREWEQEQHRTAELRRTVMAENRRAVAASGWGDAGPSTRRTVNSLGA